MINITRSEWWFVGKVGLAVAILAFAPIIAGALMTPKASVFTGQQFANYTDTMVYYSNIEQVKAGHFLFKNLFSGEQPSHRFIFDPFWLGVGLLAKVFSLSAFFAYHLSRFLLFPFLLIALYLFTALFFDEAAKRKICFVFLVFASGVGALAVGAGLSRLDIDNMPLDLVTPETFTFFSIYNSPHFIASLTLLALIFIFSILAFERYKFIYSLGAGLSALFLFQFHPYHVPTVFGVLGVFILINFIRRREINFDYLKHYFVLIIFSLPPIFYHFWTVKNIWIRQQHLLQNFGPMPESFSIFLFSFGFLAPLALIGVFLILIAKPPGSEKNVFLVVWAVTQGLLIYSPFLSFRRRLIEGLSIAVIILAVRGLFYLKEKFGLRMPMFKSYFIKNAILTVLFVFLFFLSSLAVILTDINTYLKKDPALYIKKSRYEAMRWLRSNTPDDSVVVSLPDTGNMIPAISLRQVYWGHDHQTAMSAKKKKELKTFFMASDNEARRRFLKENGIDYFFFGAEEGAISSFNPEESAYLQKVFDKGGVSIYRIL